MPADPIREAPSPPPDPTRDGGRDDDGSATSRGREVDARVLWPAARFLEDRFGPRELAQVCERAGFGADAISARRSHYIPIEQLQHFHEELREHVASDEEFMAANVHRYREAYKSLRWVQWALTPAQVLAAATRTMNVVSQVCRSEVVYAGPTSFVARQHWTKPPTKLQCLAVQAQTSHAPTFWGLPAATPSHPICQAEGGPYCEYRYVFAPLRRPRRKWIAAALGAGALAATLATATPGAASPLALALGALVGGTLPLALFLYRERVHAEQHQEELAERFRQASLDFAENRTELLALLERQDDWLASVASETRALRRAFEGIRQGAGDGAHAVPPSPARVEGAVAALDGAVSALAQRLADPGARDQLRVVEHALGMLRAALAPREVEHDSPHAPPATIELAPFVERLRRRTQALARFVGAAKASVVLERDAPTSVEIDLAAFDRLLDSLLRHVITQPGLESVVVTVYADANDLGLKLADESVRPRESRPAERLLAEVRSLASWLGGSLSAKDYEKGTTYWLRAPAGKRVRHLFVVPSPTRGDRQDE